MAEKIHLKLKEKFKLPEGSFVVRSGKRIDMADGQVKEMDLDTARAALTLKDRETGEQKFEFADPIEALAAFPDNYPHADKLTASGFYSPADVAVATDETLLDIDGIGKQSLAAIRAVTPMRERTKDVQIIQTADSDGGKQ